MKKGENIYKRKDGRFEGRVKIGYDNNGKIKYKYMYSKSYTKLKEKMKEFEKDKTAVIANSKVKKFGDVCKEYLQSIKPDVKQSTFSSYYQIATCHFPCLANIKLTKFSETNIQEYIVGLLEKGLSNKTINNIISVLKCVLDFGYKKQYINKKIIVERVKQKKKKVKILSENEKERLQSYLYTHLNYFNFCLLLVLRTGIRIGELSALQISDIYSDTVHIVKTLQRIKNINNEGKAKTKIVIDTPKTQNSDRKISLASDLSVLFEKLYKGKSGYMLTGNKKTIEPRTIENKFKRVLKECNIKAINFHTLRHTFATDFYNCTHDVKTLSEILGHSSVKITLDLYVHPNLVEQKKQIEQYSKNISSQKNSQNYIQSQYI